MDEKIIAVDCLSADLLNAFEQHEDPQSTMSDAEVRTVAIIAARFFGATYELACVRLHEQSDGTHINFLKLAAFCRQGPDTAARIL